MGVNYEFVADTCKLVCPECPEDTSSSGGGSAGGSSDGTFSVVLTDVGSSKAAVIKAVQSATGLGLKDAKALVDAAPSTIKSGLTASEAASIKTQLEAAGATVIIK